MEPFILLFETGLLVKSLPFLTEQFDPSVLVVTYVKIHFNVTQTQRIIAYHFSGTLNIVL